MRLATIYLRQRFTYAVCGLVLGLACILGGLVLLLNGIAGTTSLVALMTGLRINLNDAPPGVILTLVGGWVVHVTRYNVDVKLGP
jgi:hypothetical protein